MIHTFDSDVAVVVGSKEAVILNNLYWWIKKNQANGKNFHDGHYWTYNSIAAFSDLFPFWTSKVIRSTLDKLEADGYIITGNYNKVSYDRTKWYALTEKAFALVGKSILPRGQMEIPKKANGNAQQGKPIPVLNHNNNNNNKSGKPDYAQEREEIINYLNEKSGKSYKPNSDKTKKLISARLNEGFTVDDFKTVIDNKVSSWLGNNDMEKFLRPETLFGTKFEGYLNEGHRFRPKATNASQDNDDGFYME